MKKSFILILLLGICVLFGAGDANAIFYTNTATCQQPCVTNACAQACVNQYQQQQAAADAQKKQNAEISRLKTEQENLANQLELQRTLNQSLIDSQQEINRINSQYKYTPTYTSYDPIVTPTPTPKKPAVLGISTTDRKATDFIPNKLVPVVVERIFGGVFGTGRKIDPRESDYWKFRARTDKATESKLKGAMYFLKGKGFTYMTLQK